MENWRMSQCLKLENKLSMGLAIVSLELQLIQIKKNAYIHIIYSPFLASEFEWKGDKFRVISSINCIIIAIKKYSNSD